MNEPIITPRATFTDMKESTAEDWAIIASQRPQLVRDLPNQLLNHMKLMDGDYGGFPVDRLQHSLLTATLAQQDGRDEEYVVCALLHDIGDTLSPLNHPAIGAAIVKPFVSEANHWMVEHHGIFQGYYFFDYVGRDHTIREDYREHPFFDYTLEFCEKYDSLAFNPNLAYLPLEAFVPLIQRVFAQQKRVIYRPKP